MPRRQSGDFERAMMEHWLVEVSRTAVLLIEAMALLIIVYGSFEAFITGLGVVLGSRSGHERRDVWLRYARWLVAGLTFQLGADIINTSITTDWEAVGRLAIVAIVRTFLNYFLERDMAEVRERQGAPSVSSPPRRSGNGD